MVRRHAWWLYLTAMGALTAAYVIGHFGGPKWLNSGPVYNVIGGSTVVALVLGARMNSKVRRLPWYLFALGQALFVSGDILAYNYERFFGTALPFPSIADPFYLAFYPLLVAGLLLLIHERNEARDSASLIDALIITVAAATLSWIYLMAPYAHDSTLSLLTKLTSIAYPTMDILVLGVVLRLAVGSRRRGLSFAFLVSGTTVLLLTDAIYGWKLLHGGYDTGGVLDVGWAIFYALLGAAALHPSMCVLSQQAPDPEGRLTRRRLALLTCASMAAPTVMFVRGVLGEPLDVYVLAAAAMILFALVILRMTGLMHRHEEALHREAELTEQTLRQRSQARLGSLIKNASDVICIVGLDATIRYLSPSVEQMFGHDPAGLADAPLTGIVHPDEVQRVLAFLAAIAAQPAGQSSMAEFRVRHSTQGWRDVEALGANLLNDETIEGIVLNIRDISERKSLQAELEHQAFHDTLTGLPNRALFRNRVEHALARQLRDGLPVAVLFLDIDDFKNVNDSLGHAAGDKVLQEVGRRLEDCMRPIDTAARLGGDEFAVLINDSESEMHSIEVAQRVMSALSVALPLDDRQVTIGTSIGIAFSDKQLIACRDADELLRNADAAMYMAKESGKGDYQVFEPEMHTQALTRLELKNDLQRAMRAGEFTLRYQPIMDLTRGDMACMEALVRWEHPTRGTVAPLDFIPLVENTGMIVPLGRHILSEACKWAAHMQRECPRDPALSMAVNVSAFQLQRVEFVDEVREILEETQIAPSSLILELTESVMMRDTDLSIIRMEALRTLGVRLAIDDFGTGYSSLNYLRRFPVDILKIDRSFLADPSPEVSELTAAVVQLARIFKLQAVAEGIENHGQLSRIMDTKCEFGQGFHFAKPLTGEEILAMALEQSTTVLEANASAVLEPGISAVLEPGISAVLEPGV